MQKLFFAIDNQKLRRQIYKWRIVVWQMGVDIYYSRTFILFLRPRVNAAAYEEQYMYEQRKRRLGTPEEFCINFLL